MAAAFDVKRCDKATVRFFLDSDIRWEHPLRRHLLGRVDKVVCQFQLKLFRIAPDRVFVLPLHFFEVLNEFVVLLCPFQIEIQVVQWVNFLAHAPHLVNLLFVYQRVEELGHLGKFVHRRFEREVILRTEHKFASTFLA